MLDERFASKKALRESNTRALLLGYEYAKEHLPCPLPFHLEKMHANDDKILIDGNTAAALGCVYAGATVAAWYPITPATSVMDAFKEFCERYRKDPETGKNNYVILQAEDEIAAIGMVIGASWNGARAFTSTAGPGISLMNELLGLAYYAEIPVVVIDVQRVGPSTGMPTRTQQGDILECAYASHGDTKHILLFPSQPGRVFRVRPGAFDLAERFQTPVMMFSDLDIGMNDWVVPRLTWDEAYRPDRGRVLTRRRSGDDATFQRYYAGERDCGRSAYARRRASQRRVLHPRFGPQQIWRLYGDRRTNIRKWSTVSAEAPSGRAVCSRSNHRTSSRSAIRCHHDRRLRPGRARSSRSASTRAALLSATCGFADSRSSRVSAAFI